MKTNQFLEGNNTYKAYTLENYREIKQLQKLDQEELHNIEVVGSVYPFRVSNYVIDELIDWDNIPSDPIYRMVFPSRDMLNDYEFQKVSFFIKNHATKEVIKQFAHSIYYQLNPNAAKQDLNVPINNGKRLSGIQHKYRETVLFFAPEGQTCFSYCTFCFRWPQFVGIEALKFVAKNTQQLVNYIKQNPEITDVLLTGGDPMVMNIRQLKSYIYPLLEIKQIDNIRIGTKVFSYWPYKLFSDDILELFKLVKKKGKNLSIMAHFNHPNELKTDLVQRAIENVLMTGAQIRTQSPILKNINDDCDIWSSMWKQQVRLGMVPYYMFIPRETGAHNYFKVPLYKAYDTFNKTYKKVNGLCRTVRGPIMSSTLGKIHITGITVINGKKYFIMTFLQARNPDWVNKSFFVDYNEEAFWINDLISEESIGITFSELEHMSLV